MKVISLSPLMHTGNTESPSLIRVPFSRSKSIAEFGKINFYNNYTYTITGALTA